MNIDRSKSLYVLSWIHDKGPISEADLALELRKKYGEFDAGYIHQRLKEQSRRGVFKIKHEKYSTTKLGNLYWTAASILARVFNLNGWYSAKLTK